MWSQLAITGQDTLTLLLSFALRCVLYSRISSSSRVYSNYWSIYSDLAQRRGTEDSLVSWKINGYDTLTFISSFVLRRGTE